MIDIKGILGSIGTVLLTLIFFRYNIIKSERKKQKAKTNENAVKSFKETRKIKNDISKLSHADKLDLL